MSAHDIAIDKPHAGAAGGTIRGRARRVVRFTFAAAILAGAAVASAQVMVAAGQAVVVTRFGDPLRVLTQPGLAWKLPAPIESTLDVDLRLRTTSSGLQDVGTRDGLRVLVQAFLAWRVSADPAHIRQFIRAAGNDPDEAARQLRSFVGSALQITASNFDLADLVNTDPSKVRLAAFEQQLRQTVAQQALDIYGVDIQQVGVERLSLPSETLAATVARMRAERETVAAERTAEGLRAAAAIRSDAARDARITIAKAKADAAAIEAQSRQEAARIYAGSYALDPQLYTLLRSLDTVGEVVGPHTRLILRTDAAPFNVLVQGPPGADPKTAPSQVPPAPATPACLRRLSDFWAPTAPGPIDERRRLGWRSADQEAPKRSRSGDARPAGVLGAARLRDALRGGAVARGRLGLQQSASGAAGQPGGGAALRAGEPCAGIRPAAGLAAADRAGAPAARPGPADRIQGGATEHRLPVGRNRHAARRPMMT